PSQAWILPSVPTRRSSDLAPGCRQKALTVISTKDAGIGLTEAGRLFEHRLEHRRQVARRGVDDPQHLGGRGLLFQRLARFGDQPDREYTRLHPRHRMLSYA